MAADEDPIQLLDAVRARTAAWLHDHPVQQLVVARLALDTAAGSAPDLPPLVDRAVQAVDAAGAQTRDLMWALDPPSVRVDALVEDLEEVVGRVAAEGCAVAVDLSAAPPAPLVHRLVAAVHDLLLDVLVADAAVTAVRISADAETLTATVDDGAGGADDLGRRCAAARLRAVGGHVGVRLDGRRRTTTLTLPLP